VFTRFEKSNVLAAARRMVSYWHERKKAFGDERAYLPMNLSRQYGKSALLPQDVKTLQAGHWLHLPRCKQQQHSGRTVLYHDHSMEPLQEQTTITVTTRILFFMLQIALENEASRKQGFVLLINISNPYAAGLDKTAFPVTMRDLMTKAMPMKIEHVYLICHSPSFNDDSDRDAFITTSESCCSS
jgi:hypothetical protein